MSYEKIIFCNTLEDTGVRFDGVFVRFNTKSIIYSQTSLFCMRVASSLSNYHEENSYLTYVTVTLIQFRCTLF